MTIDKNNKVVSNLVIEEVSSNFEPIYYLDFILKEFLKYMDNASDRIIDNKKNTSEFPIIKNIIVKYTNYILENLERIKYTLDSKVPEKLYKIVYEEICNSQYSFKILKGIEHILPELYNIFKKFGGEEKSKIASDMGGLGF